MLDQTLLKTSIFVHHTGPFVFNDLTNHLYKCDPEEQRLLARLSVAPASLTALAASDPDPQLAAHVRRLVSAGLLVPASKDETGEFVTHQVDIETCRQCNARCLYCPQSVAPKPRGVMTTELFAHVLDSLGETRPQWVALNHYGEPLLDPHFRDRVRMLRERGFPLHLFTNGTLLRDPLVEFLSDGGLFATVFNFPSIDPDEWCRLMRMTETAYRHARHAIERYLSAGGGRALVAISVNAQTPDREERAVRLSEHFSAFGPIEVFLEDSDSRAGAIENSLVRIDSKGAGQRFGGCARFVNHLHVSWEGKVFLCCQDYEQRVVLGDLRRESIAAIMSSEQARRLRAENAGLFHSLIRRSPRADA
ncbi:MAG: radical SAM protein [Acidobacteria bacterium]|nr:radical SAM protein [Acidobacteriota bacterium]MCA1618609.1 radical SAM protein [Acidobacteriota bacterium]